MIHIAPPCQQEVRIGFQGQWREPNAAVDTPLFQDADSPLPACPVDEPVALNSFDFGHAGHWNDHRFPAQYLIINLPRDLLARCPQNHICAFAGSWVASRLSGFETRDYTGGWIDDLIDVVLEALSAYHCEDADFCVGTDLAQ